MGPHASAALIAADEVAVARFLDGTLGFSGIPALLEAAVERFGGTDPPDPDVEELLALDVAVRAAFATTRFGAPA
jgi:1-deoxy-D-xylulose-5-phosphate reductoisomerase